VCAAETGINQGFEARDGRSPAFVPEPQHIPDNPNHNPPDEKEDVPQTCVPNGGDGAWCEMVDIDNRGVWLSRKYKLGIWRAADNSDQYIVINDGKKQIVIRNGESGVLQIYCKGNVEVISEQNIALKAGGKISLKAGSTIDFEAGGAHMQLTGSEFTKDIVDIAPEFKQGSGGVPAEDPAALIEDKRFPADRGISTNGPFETVPERVIRVCTGDQ
jgi:hypothetical protein